ncbi:TPA: hypothetical protein ACGW67_005476, partial [Bacillus tropicus]
KKKSTKKAVPIWKKKKPFFKINTELYITKSQVFAVITITNVKLFFTVSLMETNGLWNAALYLTPHHNIRYGVLFVYE